MKKLFFGMLVAVAGVLALPSLSAQATASTGTANYTAPTGGGNYLDEYYFDVDFGTTPVTPDLGIDIANTTAVYLEIEMWMTDALTGATIGTHGDYTWRINYGQSGTPNVPAAAPGTGGFVTLWGPNAVVLTPGNYPLSGTVRFNFTIFMDTSVSTLPGDVTVQFQTSAGTIVPNTNFPIPAGTNMGANLWSQVNPATPGLLGGFGRVGNSDYFQRNFSNVVTGDARLGDPADEIQYQFDIDLGSTNAALGLGLYAFAYAQAGTATGTCIVELYDMQVGFDTPVATSTVSIGGTTSDFSTYTTPSITGFNRFRVIVRSQNLQNVAYGANTFADFGWEVYVDHEGQVQTLTNEPVIAPPRMAITPGGQAVTTTTTLTASGGTPTATYNWSFTGTPPTGVSLSATSGASVDLQVTGTPSGSAVVRATNGATGEFTEETYTFGGGGGGMVDITTTTLPNGTEGVAGYNQNITATGGTGTHSWSISTGSLPPGLSLGTSTTGTVSITGTPTTQGTYNFTIAVSDAGTGTNDSQALTIVIDPAPTSVTITTNTLPNGTDGVAYSAQIQSTGGTGTHTWTLTAGTLPPGLSLSGSTTATETLSGTPTAANTYNFTVQVSDGSGSDTQAFTVIIAPTGGGGLTIVTTTLPSGTEGQAYSTNIGATGGTGTHTWTVSAGTLPPGLSLAGSTTGNETLSGTPTASGTYNFTIMVDDGTGNDTQAFTLVIGTSGGGGGFGTGGGGGGGGGCSAIPASTPWLLFAILGLIGTVAVMRRRKQA